MYPQRLVTSALAAAAALYPWSSAGAQEPPEVWSLQEDLRTGSVDDGPYALVSIRALAISPRTGSIFLGLGPDEIRVFSAEGEYLRNISRAGEGPGELVGLAGLGWQDDFLVVLNTSRRGSSAYTFTEEGDLVASATLELPRPDDFPAAADGSAIGVLSGERYLWRFSNDWFRLEPGTRNAAPLYLLGSDGGAQRLDLLDGPRTWRIERATGRQPLARTSHVAADPDGQSIVIAHQYPTVGTGNPQFRIRRLAADGTVLYARNYRYTPVVVPRAYRDSIIDAQVEAIITGLDASAQSRSLRRALQAPEHFPPLTGLAVGTDGSVWLRREAPPADEVTWWVLAPNGDLTGQVQLPRTTRILYVNAESVWLSELGALDVPHLVRTRIER